MCVLNLEYVLKITHIKISGHITLFTYRNYVVPCLHAHYMYNYVIMHYSINVLHPLALLLLCDCVWFTQGQLRALSLPLRTI